MSNIEVGEWIRDKEGNITKVLNILSLFKDVYLYLGEDGYQYSDNAIYNHSKNIIDLIEVGDYVNGEKVIRLFNPTFLSMGELPYLITEKNKFEEYEIKSIVTWEMMKSVEYRVE